MIGYIKGKVVQRLSQAVVLDVNGVGYEIFCTQRVCEGAWPLQTEMTLYISSQTRTDGTFLYGFETPVEKLLFLQLIKVDSVGPKAALSLLSAAPADELARLIDEGALGELLKIPKVGKKTAEHLVVKLKGKLGDIIAELNETAFASPADAASLAEGIATGSKADATTVATPDLRGLSKTRRAIRHEATITLINLGFKSFDVEKIIAGIDESIWSEGLEPVIRHALKSINA